MKFDLKSLSQKELTKLRSDVDKALATFDVRKKAEARKAAEAAAAKFGLSLNDIVEAAPAPKKVGRPRKNPAKAPAKPAAKAAAPKAAKKTAAAKPKKKVAPKYKNPANPSETWTGRGRPPLWVKAALDAGKTKESLAI